MSSINPSKVLADRIKQCIEQKSNLLGCLQTSLSDAEKEFRTDDNYRMRCEGRIPPGEATIKITAKDVTVGEVIVDVQIKINEEKKPASQPLSD